MDLFTIAAAKKLAGSGGGTDSAGENGGYYTPSINEEGFLTWTPSKSDMPSISGFDLSSIGNIEFVTCRISGSFTVSDMSHTFKDIEEIISKGKYIRLKTILDNGEICYGEIISYSSNFMAFAVLVKLNINSKMDWYVGRLTINSSNNITLNFEKLFTNIDMVNYYTKEEIDDIFGVLDTAIDDIIATQEEFIGGDTE